MVIHDADQYTQTRVQIGVREKRSRLRIAKVEGGYRLGGETGRGQRGDKRFLILFGAVLSRADALAHGEQMGFRPSLWRQ